MGRVEKFRFYRQSFDNNKIVKKALINAQKNTESWKKQLNKINQKILINYHPFSEFNKNPVKHHTEPNKLFKTLQELIVDLKNTDFKLLEEKVDRMWLNAAYNQTSSGYESWISDDKGIEKINHLSKFYEANEKQWLKKTSNLTSDLKEYNKILTVFSTESFAFKKSIDNIEPNLFNANKAIFKNLVITLISFMLFSILFFLIFLVVSFVSFV
ncbi:MPN477 family protein [Mycoplasmoides genitalium]|uniref:MPN477 family protein n=1 Tax=Mycoplasmoides genitalium TaxID=2097 RepID=UPI00027B4070|nr:hypothetical protein [Mycoplasmoides genitalium]AFQ03654.1 hypothetical protein CM3_02080 [Mycoplasmoides genitalium M6282]